MNPNAESGARIRRGRLRASFFFNKNGHQGRFFYCRRKPDRRARPQARRGALSPRRPGKKGGGGGKKNNKKSVRTNGETRKESADGCRNHFTQVVIIVWVYNRVGRAPHSPRRAVLSFSSPRPRSADHSIRRLWPIAFARQWPGHRARPAWAAPAPGAPPIGSAGRVRPADSRGAADSMPRPARRIAPAAARRASEQSNGEPGSSASGSGAKGPRSGLGFEAAALGPRGAQTGTQAEACAVGRGQPETRKHERKRT